MVYKIGDKIGDFKVIRVYRDDKKKKHTVVKCINCGYIKNRISFATRGGKQVCKNCNKDAFKKWKDIIIDNQKYANVEEISKKTGLCKEIIKKYLRENNIVGLTNRIIERRMKTVVPIKGEIWKDIPGYEGKYQVSNKGRVVRLTDSYGKYRPLLVGYDWKSTKLKKYKNAAIYRVVRLPKLPGDTNIYAGGRGFKVHRLVATLFIPNPNNYPEVNHKNGDGRDNRVENLEWCTGHDNAIHARRILKRGLAKIKGENNGNAKLSWEEVKKIRYLYKECPNINYNLLAKCFNVQKSVIGDIIRNDSWVDSTYIPPARSHYFIKMGIKSKRKPNLIKVRPVTISKEVVYEIREEYVKNNISQIKLAKKYGISRALISDIVNYKRGYAKI